MESNFTVKDSGKREEFDGGMVRDTAEGKLRPDLVIDGPMFFRWVKLMTNGAKKYAARNWMQGRGPQARDRYLESAHRHFITWYMWRAYGINIEDPDNPTHEPLTEDHAAAVFFNLNGVEYIEALPQVSHEWVQDKLTKLEPLSPPLAALMRESDGQI